MYQGFLTLKRDIEDFVTRLDKFIEETGAQIAEDIKTLTKQIKDLEGEIAVLDGKIKDAQTALIDTGVCLNLIGIIVSGSVLASYQSDRNAKAADLADKQSKLEDANRKQQALAHLKTEYDGLKPSISLICEKLLLFAEIWSSVSLHSEVWVIIHHPARRDVFRFVVRPFNSNRTSKVGRMRRPTW
ncbi:DivIC domain-containing protein [Rhizoctonia solani AG-1 IA]|uniref:DivIC domain-containing protein n=1 Tax=Thanatephorus cucumeris (strain AG1-IA) TaxID=983506 RepID=L8WE10_THACA|nr:DivIC domain-containing protein [Rhizoctonia solani AG-1 IA]